MHASTWMCFAMLDGCLRYAVKSETSTVDYLLENKTASVLASTWMSVLSGKSWWLMLHFDTQFSSVVLIDSDVSPHAVYHFRSKLGIFRCFWYLLHSVAVIWYLRVFYAASSSDDSDCSSDYDGSFECERLQDVLSCACHDISKKKNCHGEYFNRIFFSDVFCSIIGLRPLNEDRLPPMLTPHLRCLMLVLGPSATRKRLVDAASTTL